MLRKLTFLLLVCGCFFIPNARAQEAAGEVKSEESRPAQQEEVSLNTYEEKLKRWQGLTEEQRQDIRERARKISPEQINEFRRRQEEFSQLPLADREKIKNNYRRFRQVPPEKRRILEERYQRFRKLPEEQRTELRRKVLERRQFPGAQSIKARQVGNVPLPQPRNEGQARPLTHPRLREYRMQRQGIVPGQHSLKPQGIMEKRDNANSQEQRREIRVPPRQKARTGNNRLQNYQQNQAEAKERYQGRINRVKPKPARRFVPQRGRRR